MRHMGCFKEFLPWFLWDLGRAICISRVRRREVLSKTLKIRHKSCESVRLQCLGMHGVDEHIRRPLEYHMAHLAWCCGSAFPCRGEIFLIVNLEEWYIHFQGHRSSQNADYACAPSTTFTSAPAAFAGTVSAPSADATGALALRL